MGHVITCFLLHESIRHFVVDAQSLILCPFDRQFQQNCFSLTNFFFSSKFKLINVLHAVSLWSFRPYQQIIFDILLLLERLFLVNSGLSPLLLSSFVAKTFAIGLKNCCISFSSHFSDSFDV